MAATERTSPTEAFIKLIRASSSALTWIHEPSAAEQVTDSQFGVLETLYSVGPLCRRDLAKKVLQSGSNITMVLDNLEKKNWIERIRSQQDRRLVTIHLTREGKELMDRVFPQVEASISDKMSVLTPEELHTLARLCRKLGLFEQKV